MSDNRFWFIFLLQFQIQPLASQWNKLNKTWIVKYFLIVYDSQDILLTTMVTYCKIHLQPTIITIFICMKYSEMNSINIHVFLVCFFSFSDLQPFNLSCKKQVRFDLEFSDLIFGRKKSTYALNSWRIQVEITTHSGIAAIVSHVSISSSSTSTLTSILKSCP